MADDATQPTIDGHIATFKALRVEVTGYAEVFEGIIDLLSEHQGIAEKDAVRFEQLAEELDQVALAMARNVDSAALLARMIRKYPKV